MSIMSAAETAEILCKLAKHCASAAQNPGMGGIGLSTALTLQKFGGEMARAIQDGDTEALNFATGMMSQIARETILEDTPQFVDHHGGMVQ